MKICVIGSGYVGLVVGSCLAEMGNEVICVDKNEEKIHQLQNGIIPIYEAGLEELINTNIKNSRLIFSNDLTTAVKNSLICFIAVDTPQLTDGSAALGNVYDVATQIGKAINDYKIIVTKSTVPVGTTQKISEIISSHTTYDFDIISNPEFLKQGTAIEDFSKPDRIIIGSNSTKATKIIKELYAPFVRTGNPIITMDIKSAEMTKYASNSFLALKISYANEIANICEAVGADNEMVRLGLSADKRIGAQFLFAGLGFGGSCFPKDIKALTKTAIENNCDYKLLQAIEETNQKQRQKFIAKILNNYNNNVKEKTFAIWGLSFKPKTNDIREAPAITIINALLEKGAKIQAYDPKATNNAKLYFQDKITYATSSYEALENADALMLLTEWNEFRHPDFDKIKTLLKTPTIFDVRNQYINLKLKEKGFNYFCIGKKDNN